MTPRLEDHQDAYTSQELEHFVLSRISANIGWGSGREPRRTNVKSDYEDPDFALVEGGRWLLVMEDGRVYAHDLDALLEQQRQLILDTRDHGPKLTKSSLQIDIDYHEAILTFNLSIYPHRNTEKNTTLQTLQIYQVHLTGHGKDAKLISQLLNHFFSRVEVYDWTLSNANTRFDAALINPIPVRLSFIIHIPP